MDLLWQQLRNSRQRQLVLFEGSRDWCDAMLGELQASRSDWRLFSDRAELAGACPPVDAESCLGSETDLVMVDVFGGYDPDLLCIAAGLVRASGVLALFAPSPADWDAEADQFGCWQDGERSQQPLFADWLRAEILHDPATGLLVTASTPPPIPPLPQLEPTPIDDGCTADQRRALDEINNWLERKAAGVVLLEAARGRGKSTCLGRLAASLAGRLDCLVCAPSRRAAQLVLANAPQTGFVAPDRLLLERPAADLLLLDEAAMIPQAMLRQICRCYPRVVMATTSGGYEGTGQGFRLRFVARFDVDRLLRLSLSAPVRWCEHDLLERWLERTLMPLPPAAEPTPGVGRVEIEIFDRDAQPPATTRLREAFALLAAAHYRTRPSDLRMLMENPALVLLTATLGSRLVGAAVLNVEGGFADDLCEAVFYGRRRPRGHLLAQMMTAQAGLRGFASRRGMRVQRIAVADDCRRQGIGGALLERACVYARQRQYAYLGASFALDPDGAEFWRSAGFELAHISYAAGKSSGGQSIVVLRLLDEGLGAALEAQRHRIQRQLPLWLLRFLRLLEHDQVVVLLRLLGYRYAPSTLERDDLDAFVHGQRGFELCFASLQPQVMHAIAATHGEIDPLLVEKVVLDRPWDQLPRAAGDEGRKQLQQRLRGLVDDLIKAC